MRLVLSAAESPEKRRDTLPAFGPAWFPLPQKLNLEVHGMGEAGSVTYYSDPRFMFYPAVTTRAGPKSRLFCATRVSCVGHLDFRWEVREKRKSCLWNKKKEMESFLLLREKKLGGSRCSLCRSDGVCVMPGWHDGFWGILGQALMDEALVVCVGLAMRGTAISSRATLGRWGVSRAEVVLSVPGVSLCFKYSPVWEHAAGLSLSLSPLEPGLEQKTQEKHTHNLSRHHSHLCDFLE